ncbi:MAG: CotH kinase family protein, partial [Crocinitomicaceae bacterium]
MRKLYKFLILKVLVLILLVPFTAQTQAVLYNPQTLYDAPGGFYDQSMIREMNIQFYDANYHNILRNAFFNNPAYRIPAVVSLDGMSYDSVGVRYKGNSTFCIPNDEGNPKVPYNLDANYWVSGQKIADYKKLKFANAWMDPTFAKEITATNIYQKYMPSPEVNLLKVKVQGNYLGLYVNTESINKQFMEKHFGEKDGVLFKCDPAQVFCGNTNPGGNPDLKWLGPDSTNYYTSYDLKSESGWGELMDLIYTLNYDFENLGSILNIDRVLWNFAVNTAILNLDTYNGYYVHNYYLYRTEDGLFQMIPWDFDNAFVGAILGFEYWSPEVVYNYDSYGSQYDANSRPLFQKLMADPLRKKQFDAHLRTIFSETLLDTASIRNDIAELHEEALIPAN